MFFFLHIALLGGGVQTYVHIGGIFDHERMRNTHTHMFIALLLFLADGFPKIILLWLCYLLSPSYSKLPGGTRPGAKSE